MALTATIYNFDIDLADTDRGVYETLALRVAQHPSESPEYLVARVLAYGLEYTEGIGFSSGIWVPPISIVVAPSEHSTTFFGSHSRMSRNSR